MKKLYPSVGLEKLCRLFGKTRQAYYDHSRRASGEQLQEALIVDLVKTVRVDLPKIGGNKLLIILTDAFTSHNISMGRDRFFRLLRKYDLLVKRKKRYARTTMSDHHFKKWPDLTTQLQLTSIEQLWVSDITYLSTKNGFIYLSLITDAYSHKIIGYHLSQHLKAQGCLIALHKAIATLHTGTPVIHHSDRGIQYCCNEYTELLQNAGIAISMTQSGSPYDNAVAERANGILKTELGLDQVFTGYSDAVPAVHRAISSYNHLRPHMSCSNLTPEIAHLHPEPLVKKWKPGRYRKADSVLL